MKLGLIFLLFLILGIKSKSINTISLAISQIIQELFIKPEISFDILDFNSKSLKMGDIVKGFLKVTNNMTSVEVKKSKTFQNISKSAVIFLKSFNDFQKLNQRVELKNKFPKKLKFLIFCQDLSISDIQKVVIKTLDFKNRGHISQFEYFVTETKKEIILSTIEWFSEIACDLMQIKILGKFDKKFKTWKMLKVNEKFVNFHKCLIVDQKLEIDVDKFSGEPSGYMIEFTKILAQVGNFTPYFQFIYGNSLFSSKRELKPIHGKVLIPHTMNLRQGINAMGNIHFTSIIEDFRMIFVTTPGEEFSSYEKLFLPFDAETWLYLEVYFGVCLIVIFIINRMSLKIRNEVYGFGINSAAFNVISNIFGIPLHQMPKNNFARIILIFFVFYCLIIRTAYQGNL